MKNTFQVYGVSPSGKASPIWFRILCLFMVAILIVLGLQVHFERINNNLQSQCDQLSQRLEAGKLRPNTMVEAVNHPGTCVGTDGYFYSLNK